MTSWWAFLRRNSLVIGIVLMFLYTWTFDLSNSGILPFHLPLAVYITVGWGFIFVSLLMTGLTLGRQGALTLLKRFLIWRVNWKWHLNVGNDRTHPDWTIDYSKGMSNASRGIHG